MKKLLAILALCLAVGPASGQFISSGGSGTGGSATPCTTTAGAIQYNNAGAFGCVSNATSGGAAISVTSQGLVINGNGAKMQIGADATGDVYTLNNASLSRVAVGTSGQVLTVNGATNLPIWTTFSATGTPCTTTASAVQFNNAGAFGCVSGVTSDGTAMTATGSAIKIGGSISGSTALAAASAASGTFSIPAATGTAAEINLAQTWTADQTFSANVTANALAVTGLATAQRLSVATGASTQNLTIRGITGTANNCLQADTNGNVSGTAAGCGGSGGITAGTTATTGYSAGQIVYSDGSHAQATSGTAFTLPSVPTASVLAISTGVVTTNVQALNITGTWNNSSTTFDAPLFMNVTNTASAAASLLMDLQVGSSSQLNIDKAGNVNVPNSAWTLAANAAQTFDYGATHVGSWNFTGTVYLGSNSVRANAGSGTLEVFSGGAIGFDSGAITTTLDTQVFRDAAGILAQRNGTNAQTFRVYNTFTDASNYERGVFDWTTNSNNLLIGTQCGGTGTCRPITITASGTAITIATNQNIALPAITSDATHTTATVCEDTTTHVLYSGSGAASICVGTSSLRFKHDVRPLDAGLAQIVKLEPITYKLNADHGDPNHVLYGFSAEQGGQVLPELMGKDQNDKPNTFDYMGVVPVLVKAIQEQQKEIEELKRKLQ